MYISKELYEQVQNITNIDYEAINSMDEKRVYVKDEMIKGIIEDLIGEINHIKGEFKEYEENIQDNYERIPISRQVL